MEPINYMRFWKVQMGRLKKLLSWACVYLLVFSSPVGIPLAVALPGDPTVVSGTATFENIDPQTLQITASGNSIIEFGSYNIGASEAVIYVLPNASASTLSRVIGGSATSIYGSLSANGTLFLVNVSGITFGSTARVNVGGLVASTLPINNADFLAGNFRFDGSGLSNIAAVVNHGNIAAAEGGYAVLVGGAAQNTGTISAPLGTVALAVGKVVTIGISADNKIAIVVDMPVAEGILDGQGGKVCISRPGTYL